MIRQIWFKKVLGFILFLVLLSMVESEIRQFLIGLIAGLFIAVYFQMQAHRKFFDFFALSSHELRTPLTSMKLLIQMNQRALKVGRSEAEVIKMLEDLEVQVNRMSKFVNKMQTEAEVTNIRESNSSRHATTLNSLELS